MHKRGESDLTVSQPVSERPTYPQISSFCEWNDHSPGEEEDAEKIQESWCLLCPHSDQAVTSMDEWR